MEKKKKKSVKLIKDAGNVEQNIAFANKGLTYNATASNIMAENKKMTINIKKELEELDSDNKYDLVERYYAIGLDDKGKKELAKLLYKKAPITIISNFLSRYDGYELEDFETHDLYENFINKFKK